MKSNKLVSTAVLVVLLICSVFTASLAWFSSYVEAHTEGEFSASSIAAYFAAGDGSSTNPYIIMTPKHLYNLS